MSYGTLKIDTITFTDNGIDKSVSVSGLVQNPSFSGNITATGTISGNIVRGQTISGVTVTGTTAAFTTGTFISLTGTTTEGTTAAFASGVFTTQISGATITGNAAAFNTVTGGIATITSGVFASGTAAAPSVSVGTTDNGIYSPGADQVAISTNGAGRLFVDASGKLGLGTSDPGSYSASANQLVIAGSGDSGLTIRSGTANSSSIYFADGTTGSELYQGIIYYNHTNDSLNFHTNYAGSSSARMVIDSAGKVGLGTASPSSLLHLEGSDGVAQIRLQRAGTNIYGIIRQTSVPYGLTYDAVDTNTGTPTHAFRTSADGSTFFERLRITSDGKVGLGTSSPSSRLHVQDASGNAQLRITGTGGYTELYSDGNFYIQPNGSTKMVVQSGGNVGVGTTGPTDKLHLHEASSNANYLHITNDTTGSAGGDGVLIGLDSSEQFYIYSQENNDMIFGTNNAERMRLDSSGRLGLGTSSPGVLLDINGSGNIVRLGDGTNTIDVRFEGPNNWAAQLNTSTDIFNIQRNSVPFLAITGAGNVGVGTTSVNTTLEVLNSSTPIIRVGDGTRHMELRGGSTTQNAAIGTNYAGGFDIIQNGGAAVTIDASKRVLVGTSTARTYTTGGAGGNHKLQLETAGASSVFTTAGIYSNSDVAGIGAYLELGRSKGTSLGAVTAVAQDDILGEIRFAGTNGSGSNSAASIAGYVDGVVSGGGANDMPGRLVFSTTADGASSPTERMRISQNGSISIGTTASGYAKVDIRDIGSTWANGLYVERTSLSNSGQGIYSYMTVNTGLINSSYALYSQFVANTNSPGGGCIGIISSVYGILGYFDTANSWAGYFNGSTYATGSYQGSDARLKDIIEPISGGILNKLASIQPVRYKWKENTDQRETVGDSVQIGLIAQEVEQHFPELVKEVTHSCPIDPDRLEEGQFDSSCSLNHELGTFKTLEYQHLTAVLVEALKEAKERIETLEAKVAALEAVP